jgi:DNA-binding transcriptional LysR family regulator
VSSSTAGVHAAVRGGLGIAMIPQSAMIPGVAQANAPADGVPELPDFEIAIFPARGARRRPASGPLSTSSAEEVAIR